MLFPLRRPQNLIMARNKDGQYDRKAAILVGELLALSTRVLPLKYGTQWQVCLVPFARGLDNCSRHRCLLIPQTLPRLFAMASHYDDIGDRLRATGALQSIDKYTRQQTRQQATLVSIQNSRNRANSLDDPLTRGQRQIENSKIRMGMQIDDTTWKNKLLETQILVHKEHTKWNYDAILEIVEGPLLNPARFNEAVRGTKFMRRLITFFYPSERRYSDMDNTPVRCERKQASATLLGFC